MTLPRRKIYITCGTGGVGKTTLSAALGIRLAMEGRRVVVITMDPAKRLATSLGLDKDAEGAARAKLCSEPTDLTSILSASLQLDPKIPKQVSGQFWALMPDTRSTFEQFVRELAPDPKVAERVLKSRIFEIFAKEFSGTNEYMALEKLEALERDTRFDAIVLDTPPSRNTLAFLEAPRVLNQFFDERIMKWLVLPSQKIFAFGIKKALGVLETLTGAGFMTDLIDFAQALFEVRARFVINLTRIEKLLASSQVGFLLVTALAPDTLDEAKAFLKQLEAKKYHWDGVLLNRCLSSIPWKFSPKSREDRLPEERLIEELQKRERNTESKLRESGLPILARVPELRRDIHQIGDLHYVAQFLP